jgi:hypothetical protein
MNIFYLSRCPHKSAKLMCDKHIVKMILESAQMLCTAHHVNGTLLLKSDIYKPAYKNHPSTVWVRESALHYNWLYMHFLTLCDEYTRRYGKVHLTYTKLAFYLASLPKQFPKDNFRSPPKCMPDIYKKGHTVFAYRKYYANAKKHFAKYTNTPVPNFLRSNFYHV